MERKGLSCRADRETGTGESMQEIDFTIAAGSRSISIFKNEGFGT